MGLVGLISEALSGMSRNRARLPDGGGALSGLHTVMPMGFVGLISEAPSGIYRTVPDCRMAAVPYPAYIS
ncbi:hypothetical protein [Kosakonia sp. CFBP8986]|uniref:hypothetical protein n=1 Tax=Kosakonia sp. CFBP8986 TaxID=3096524 RepID=UPI002A6B372B|nr:hypothetical protein [Kosakonia sp. CFBP8986]